MDRDELRDLARLWDGLAAPYVEHLYDELDHKPRDRELLARVAELAEPHPHPVLDLGCGPGHVTRHLHDLGVSVRGLDLSAAMIEVAHQLNPDIPFEVGDMLELDLESWSLGGAVAFYSLIHLVPEDVERVVTALGSAIEPGGPLLMAVHSGQGFLTSDEVLGQPITMAIRLYTADELAGMAENAGFEVEVCETRKPYPEEGGTERAYVLARRR